MNDDIPGGMGAPQMHQINTPVAQIHRHVIAKGGGGIGQTWNAFMTLKQAWKALKFTVPILLATFDYHSAGASPMMICSAPKAEAPSTRTA